MLAKQTLSFSATRDSKRFMSYHIIMSFPYVVDTGFEVACSQGERKVLSSPETRDVVL